MITFFSGSTFNQVIQEVISGTEELQFPAVVSDEIDFEICKTGNY